jgi:hypothetical protein
MLKKQEGKENNKLLKPTQNAPSAINFKFRAHECTLFRILIL